MKNDNWSKNSICVIVHILLKFLNEIIISIHTDKFECVTNTRWSRNSNAPVFLQNDTNEVHM